VNEHASVKINVEVRTAEEFPIVLHLAPDLPEGSLSEKQKTPVLPLGTSYVASGHSILMPR
jgi:hypothetical protein